MESNIASHVAYRTGSSARTYDLNLFPVLVGSPDGPVSPKLFIFPLELGFPADDRLVSEVDFLAFLGRRRSIMTRETARISFPVAPPRDTLAPGTAMYCCVMMGRLMRTCAFSMRQTST